MTELKDLRVFGAYVGGSTTRVCVILFENHSSKTFSMQFYVNPITIDVINKEGENEFQEFRFDF